MKVLIVYDTYTGGTELASQIIETMLRASEMHVTRKRSRTVVPKDLDEADMIVLGSPSWIEENTEGNKEEGMPHKKMIKFMDKYAGIDFKKKPFAIYGLGVKEYKKFAGAVDHLEKFVKDHNGNIIVDSLRVDDFYCDNDQKANMVRYWVHSLINKIEGVEE